MTTPSTHRILVLPGDGIGPEIIAATIRVLEAVGAQHGFAFEWIEDHIGGCCIDQFGVALREQTITEAGRSEAVLFGAVGDPKYDDPNAPVRPEQAILGLRKALGLFANLRPVRVLPCLAERGPLRPERVADTDMVIVRELTGGIYFGQPRKRWVERNQRRALDTMTYEESEIRRIVRAGFELARVRRQKLTSVDKANVLDTSRLWREVATETAEEFPDVTLEHVLVDAMAMHLITRPRDFDVVVTANLFGDVLSDETSVLSGSLGVMPSASLGERRPDGTYLGLYEPIHGSAPDIAGRGVANPVGTILSGAMLLRSSLGREAPARAIEQAVEATLEAGTHTADLGATGAVGTEAMADAIIAQLTPP